jgi:N12 class adenine-specific DNA methylase
LPTSHSQPTLVSDGKDIKEALAEAVKRLPSKIYEPLNRSLDVTATEQSIPAPGHVKPNAYTLHDDEIAIREGDKLIPLSHLPIQTKLRIRSMIKVRDAVRQCLRTQLEDADESEIQLARAQLNQTYDRFRIGLRRAGLIAKADSTVTAFERLDLTDAQKRDKRFYPANSVIVFNRETKDFAKGEYIRPFNCISPSIMFWLLTKYSLIGMTSPLVLV